MVLDGGVKVMILKRFSELVKKALEADLNEMKTNETKYLMENYTANMIYKNINKSIGWK